MNAMYPTEVYYEIASMRAQDLRNEAAHERLLRQTAQSALDVGTVANRDAAYRRLAIAILGLDVNTLRRTLRSA